MDYKDYTEKKTDGRVELVKAGGGFAIATKRWNHETGEQDDPEIVAVDVSALQEKKTALQAEIAGIDKVLSDINKL
jgi:uncharacterized protein YlxW (UPF0749 family)